MKKSMSWMAATVLAVGFAVACQPAAKKEEAKPDAAAAAKAEAAAPAKALRGVDMEKKVIRIGMLNDESGPAAIIGKPFAVGKRILAQQVNEGGSGLLPDGWTIELVEPASFSTHPAGVVHRQHWSNSARFAQHR